MRSVRRWRAYVLHNSDKAVEGFVIDNLFAPVGLKKRNDLVFGVVGVHADVMGEVVSRINVGTLVDIIHLLCNFACALVKTVHIAELAFLFIIILARSTHDHELVGVDGCNKGIPTTAKQGWLDQCELSLLATEILLSI